jgi:hypothetical protein
MALNRDVILQPITDTPLRQSQRKKRVIRQRPDLADKDIVVVPVIEVTVDLVIFVLYRHFWVVLEGSDNIGVFWPNRNVFEDAVPMV